MARMMSALILIPCSRFGLLGGSFGMAIPRCFGDFLRLSEATFVAGAGVLASACTIVEESCNGVSKGRAEMWSACACACVCVCSPVRTYVDAMRCAGCSCVNDAVDGRIAGRSTPKRKASYSSHTCSYFSYRFHISSHVVTPGKVQFSLGMSAETVV